MSSYCRECTPPQFFCSSEHLYEWQREFSEEQI
ncbi:hypothetical protein LCGC14_2539350, partial [marine sediment metagenome]